MRTATNLVKIRTVNVIHFNPRGPCGPRHSGDTGTLPERIYFNPRGPCGPRPAGDGQVTDRIGISILAVLADRDPRSSARFPWILAFQSSRSLRTATGKAAPIPPGMSYFNPRGPCGPRRRKEVPSPQILYFNPRGPCGPRLLLTTDKPTPDIDFNPRGPCGPRQCPAFDKSIDIRFQSSRSLRTATASVGCWSAGPWYFNPRGPCGPRRSTINSANGRKLFQSSRSLRTATGACPG